MAGRHEAGIRCTDKEIVQEIAPFHGENRHREDHFATRRKPRAAVWMAAIRGDCRSYARLLRFAADVGATSGPAREPACIRGA
jgi:hypothetical protein